MSKTKNLWRVEDRGRLEGDRKAIIGLSRRQLVSGLFTFIFFGIIDIDFFNKPHVKCVSADSTGWY